MKKIICFTVCLMCFMLLACDKAATNSSTTTFSTTIAQTTTTEELTTTTENSFSPIYSSTVESDLAIFVVTIDYAEIDSSNDTITVTVEITAKVDIDQELGTSSYGDLGIIEIRVVSVDDEEIALYSEFYDIPVTQDIYAVHIDADDTLIRTMQFARMPFHGGAGGEQPSSTGIYKVQVVAMWVSETVWIDTNITIRVVD